MRDVPFSTYVLMTCIMGLWFSCATLITLQAPWPWWIIVVVLAIPTATISGQRYARRRRAKAELRAAAPTDPADLNGPGR